MMRGLMGAALVCVTLAGCTATPAPRSRDFFDKNPDVREDVVAKCKSGVGDHPYEPQAECPAAIESDAKARRDHDLRAFGGQ